MACIAFSADNCMLFMRFFIQLRLLLAFAVAAFFSASATLASALAAFASAFAAFASALAASALIFARLDLASAS